jgi:hypothetical protein
MHGAILASIERFKLEDNSKPTQTALPNLRVGNQVYKFEVMGAGMTGSYKKFLVLHGRALW